MIKSATEIRRLWRDNQGTGALGNFAMSRTFATWQLVLILRSRRKKQERFVAPDFSEMGCTQSGKWAANAQKPLLTRYCQRSSLGNRSLRVVEKCSAL
jgi:hypothetical protein